MSDKFYKLSRRERELKQPLESRFIKLTSLALATFLVTFLSISILTPVQPSSASESTNTNITANISATNYYLTLSSTATNLDISATPGGALTAATDTVSVKTNNPNGYKLYLSMNDSAPGANRLYLNGNTTSSSYFSPTSGTFTNPKKLDANSWGYALAESDASAILTKLSLTPTTHFDSAYSNSPSSDSVWAAVPLKGSDQLIKSTNQADESDTSSNVSTSVYYAANANVAQPSGTYKGTILYTVIADTGSTTDSASVSPTQIYSNTTGQSITISTNLYADANKIGDTTITIGNASTSATSCPITSKTTDSSTGRVKLTCTAPSLSAGTYTLTINIPFYDKTYTIENGLTYVQHSLYELANGKTMQNMTSAICAAAAVDTAKTTNFATMTDSRDSKTYRVAKLDDGHCWMIDNLRLGNANTAITLNSSTSDVSSNYSIAASAIVSSGNTNWSTSVDANHIYVQSDNSYGNLYNWYSATAGTGTSSMKSDSMTSTNNATSSVCPKGWKLPLGNQSDYSYYHLFQKASITNDAAGSNKVRSAPYHFTYAGTYSIGAETQGSVGRYWSRSASSLGAESALFLAFTSSYADPQNGTYKYIGSSVRCVYTG